MPYQNVLIGGHAGFNPFGSQLESMVKHGKRYAAEQGLDKVREYTQDFKRQKSEEYFNRLSRSFGVYKSPASAPGKKSKMVYRKRTSFKRRRPYRRVRRRFAKRKRSIVPMLWPRQQLVKFRVVATGAFVCAAGGASANGLVMKADSLNDPTGATSANLPLGLDQWAGMYSKYVVTGSRIQVRFHPSALTGSIICGVSLLPESSVLATSDYYMELPRTRSKMLTGDLDHTTLGINYGAKRYWKTRKLSDCEDLNATFSTTPGDPSDLAYYHIWAQDVNKTDGATVEVAVTIEFICLLRDPITPTRSSL